MPKTNNSRAALLAQLTGDSPDRRSLKAELMGDALAHPRTHKAGLTERGILDEAEKMADAIIARVWR